MAITIEVRGFTGQYAGLNARPTTYPVGMAELINKAITVGGFVQGSPLERTWRRSAVINMMLSSVRAVGPVAVTSPLTTTMLYVNTETTEKTGISFRLGMALAAVAAGRVLDTRVLKHVSPRAGGRGRRADLFGIDRVRARHIVEAKSRSYGFSTSLVKEAKRQAGETCSRFVAAGIPIATASASMADLSQTSLYVLFEDPPPSDGDAAWAGFEEDEVVRDFYSPVPDLLATGREERSGYASIDDVAIGGWMPGSDAWLGLDRNVYAHLQRGEDPIPETLADVTGSPAEGDWLTSLTSDGHAVVLGPRALDSAHAE